MWALVVPEKNSRWALREVPKPNLEPNQVLIKIRASGICFTDVHITEGVIPAKFPRILGHEPTGEIVELGSGVRTRQLGDRVGVSFRQAVCGRCESCLSGTPLFCTNRVNTGVHIDGGNAEYMAAYADATVLLPNELSYEQAAPILCSGYSAWGGLSLAQPKPGARIAVVGIGALGHLALQYAKAAGFETIAVTHSQDKIEVAYQLGADHVVTSGEELKNIGSADVILDATTSHKFVGRTLKGLRPGGCLVVMGISDELLEIPNDVLFKRWRIIGSGHNGFQFLYEALDFAAKGKVRAMTELYGVQDVSVAFDTVSKGAVRFSAVLVVH
jgi:D-arabinose 1-dehydrogenase-like Zn-dependent alcohol dehydrogenase